MFRVRPNTALFAVLLSVLSSSLACGGYDSDFVRPSITREDVSARFGPPDQVEAFPEGPPPRPIEEGNGDGFPFEIWHYKYLNELRKGVTLEFVDACLCGYVLDPTADNAALREILVNQK